jgi:curved DNA-binding protein CbpA
VDDDPFAALGLPARAGLTDDDVRAAWRRVAAATHPDREDGGDPPRFGAAAAAYAMLRTSYGRGEALADLGASGDRHRAWRRARHGARQDHGARRGRASWIGTSRIGVSRLLAHRTGGHRASARRVRAHGVSAHRVSAHRVSARQNSAQRSGSTSVGATEIRNRRVRAGAGPGPVTALGRGLTVRVASAAVLAAAAVAAFGLTPATIGLLTGALTVTGWALWRRGGWGR